MTATATLRNGLRIMMRFKLRTLFMTTGIVVGITALTLVVSVGAGTRQQIMNNVQRFLNPSDIVVLAAAAGDRSVRDLEFRGRGLTLDDLEAIQTQVTNIRDYDAFVGIAQRSVKFGTRSMDLAIAGNTERSPVVWNRGVTSGRFFDAGEVRTAARVALVGCSLVDRLFGGADPVGQQIRIGTAPFEVIGVLAPLGIDPHGNDRDLEIMVPVTTAMKRVDDVDYVTGAKFRLLDETRVEETSGAIAAVLRERHRLADGEPDDFRQVTATQVRAMLSGMNRLFEVVLPALAGITLLVGGILVAALMLITVNERRGEIGLRKAIGARDRDIVWQFVSETLLVAVSGGLVGFALGVGAVAAMVAAGRVPPMMPWQALVWGVATSAAVGLAAAVLPALRAARMSPADALR